MVRRLASFISLSALRATASKWSFSAGSVDSGSLHEGQRLAKPGLSGLSSNSSEQMTQVLIGKAIHNNDNADDFPLPISLRLGSCRGQRNAAADSRFGTMTIQRRDQSNSAVGNATYYVLISASATIRAQPRSWSPRRISGVIRVREGFMRSQVSKSRPGAPNLLSGKKWATRRLLHWWRWRRWRRRRRRRQAVMTVTVHWWRRRRR